jgi:hypothetical protein
MEIMVLCCVSFIFTSCEELKVEFFLLIFLIILIINRIYQWIKLVSLIGSSLKKTLETHQYQSIHSNPNICLPIYLGRFREDKLHKVAYGAMGGCYWEHAGEHIGNLRNQEIQQLPPPSSQKKKDWSPWVHASSPHWLDQRERLQNRRL